jgi:hypothetical protein
LLWSQATDVSDHRQPEDVVQLSDPIFFRHRGKVVAELDTLPREGDGHGRRGKDDPERHGDRQDRRREGLAAAHAPPQMPVEGKQDQS